MKGFFPWIVVWVGLIGAGYLVADRLTTPPPLARSLTEGRQEITIPVSRDGHFYLDGAINGVPLRFMVDTGASYVSVGEAFAKSARLPKGATGYFNTAGGAVEGRIVRDQDVKADVFQVSGISVAVLPTNDVEGLLGQNFLRHFEVSQTAGVMRLRLNAGSAPR